MHCYFHTSSTNTVVVTSIVSVVPLPSNGIGVAISVGWKSVKVPKDSDNMGLMILE